MFEKLHIILLSKLQPNHRQIFCYSWINCAPSQSCVMLYRKGFLHWLERDIFTNSELGRTLLKRKITSMSWWPSMPRRVAHTIACSYRCDINGDGGEVKLNFVRALTITDRKKNAMLIHGWRVKRRKYNNKIVRIHTATLSILCSSCCALL